MSRDDEIIAFLSRAGWGAAARDRLPGDASTRSYERLTMDGRRAMLMNQPRAVETEPCPPDADPEQRTALGYNALARLAAGRVDAFVACARHLKSLGLSAPDILYAEPENGLAVLEDLGDALYARLIETGTPETPLYEAAIDALVTLHAASPPDVLPGGWPLLSYDELALKTAHDIFTEWMPRFRPVSFDNVALAAWEALWAPVRAHGAAHADVFCHRDYHAENLIWLPDRAGAARVGLLDFQDAVKAHKAWDLSMLLHDARRTVSPELEAACLERYLAATGLARASFLSDYHALGALNIVRILGIFARLVTRDGKPRYAAFMPRLWTYLDRCLADPALTGMKAWFDAHVPVEART